MRLLPLAVALPFALPVPPLASPRVPDGDGEAVELFEKAELRVSQAKYKEARRLYRKIAKEYPNTAVGKKAILRSKSSAYCGWAYVVQNGPSENRVDVVLMGESYQLEEQGQFDDLAEDVPPYFERQATFREYYSYFNFLRANLISADNGVDGFGRDYDTALGARTLATYAGHIGIDQRAVRATLEEMPHHDGQAIIFVNGQGVGGTGGGGIATIGGRSIRTAIHEFGHSFGRLSDEYSSETHKRGGVRRNVNVTNSEDPKSAPWKHWIEAKVPGIGMYEGASGQARGAWKPTSGGCVMESGEFFCRVCREQLVLRIYEHVDPIESCDPLPHPRDSKRAQIEVGTKGVELSVSVLKPDSHPIEVSWWVVPEAKAPHESWETGSTSDGTGRTETYRRSRARGRSARGPLPTITAKPDEVSRVNRTGEHSFRIKRSDLEPGRYRVICRARDTTKIRGEKWPWVLRDENGVLESQRGWWVVVPEDG